MLKTNQVIGIVIGSIVLIVSLVFFLHSKAFLLLIGVSVIIGVLPTIVEIIRENNLSKEKEELFLVFALDLVESVKSGIPLAKSIVQLANRNYYALTPHIRKLASQVSIAIPVKQALRIFASDINNKVISRSVELIIEAESAGGDLGKIIDAVVKNVREIEELKKERASKVFSMVIQGYIIFFLFIAIMLFVEFKFMPMLSGALSGSATPLGSLGYGGSSSTETATKLIENSFFILLLTQAFFAGLVIGKLSEGSLKAGIKHSGILLVIAYLAITAAKAFL